MKIQKIVGIILLTLLPLSVVIYFIQYKKTDFELALEHYNNGNPQKALDLFIKLAEQGNVKAQFYLGNMYFLGYGVHKNYKKAVMLYTKAANKNLPEAQNNLATCSLQGLGTTKNTKRGIALLKIASLQDFHISLFRLGLIYYGEKKFILAFHYLKKAAEKGNLKAECILGEMYMRGIGGVKQSFLMSDFLLNDAAKKGDKNACFFTVINFYLQGKQDKAQSFINKLKKKCNLTKSEQKSWILLGELICKDRRKGLNLLKQIITKSAKRVESYQDTNFIAKHLQSDTSYDAKEYRGVGIQLINEQPEIWLPQFQEEEGFLFNRTRVRKMRLNQ